MGSFEEQVFVTRFWRADDAGGAGGWRGYVDHLPTARRRFFVDVSELSAFILACLSGDDVGALDDAPRDST